MSEFIPKELIDILSREIPPLEGLFFVSADKEGYIKSWAGDYSNYLKDKLDVGMPITKPFPFLTGMISSISEKIFLPQIQLFNKKYCDVTVIKNISDSIWFVLTDTTLQAESLESTLQEINEKNLNLEKTNKKSGYEDPFGHIELFRVATFKKEGNVYTAVGNQPKWITELIPGIEKDDKQFDLTSLFPFLEVFQSEASEFWNNDEKGFFTSGLWAQENQQGKEYLLRAFAAKKDGKKFLLIWAFSELLPYEKDILQTAREQELAYEKLAKAEARLKELLEYKEKFVSIISHDLRSPVASVHGISEMLLNDEDLKGKLDEFNRGLLLDIKNEMSRLLDYNAKLYHWSNLELGNFKLVLEEVEISMLVKIAEQTGQKGLKEKNISFDKNLRKNLTINVDITLFLQALNNLVSNAIKFTPENGSITIEASKETSGKVVISVSDTGVGMNEKMRQALFSKRITTHGTSGEKGSGLGLGIVKKVVEAHGFSLAIESEPGKGSCFKIII